MRAMWRVLPLLALAGCATPRPAPRGEHLDFGGVRATWRPFVDNGICEAEPRFLRDELLSVNEVLKRFLKDSEGDAAAPWPDAQVKLVADAQTALPPVMEVHERNLRLVAGCEFHTSGGYPVVLERGDELLRDVRARLKEAPLVIAEVRRKRAMDTWNQQRLSSQDSARRTCPPPRPGAAVLYFAFRDAAGLTSYFFCDGAAVMKREGEAPRLEPAPFQPKRGKRVTEKAYLAATDKYPAEAVVVPPPEALAPAAP